jgi:predicted HD superfamily hydrolase involved in NAD metabolism
VKLKTPKEYEALLWKKYQETNDDEVDERYRHSLSVAKKALELIDRFHLEADKTKAEIAGILHDYAKFESLEAYLEVVKEYHLNEAWLSQSPKILHALLGPWIIRKELDLDDGEILKAISLHTTGSLSMGVLDEVIFLADFIDDTREGNYFEEAKQIALINFHQAIAAKIKRRLEKAPNDELSLAMYKKYAEVPWKA